MSASSSSPLLGSPDRRQPREQGTTARPRRPPDSEAFAVLRRIGLWRRTLVPRAKQRGGPAVEEEPRLSPGEPAVLDHEVVGGSTSTTTLLPGETWTFGRSKTCSETLTVPALSR